jgi:ADP-heptose:LPS heptosyltransferase
VAKRFLIIQTAFIGDVILATALIEKLHAFYPDAEIHFLIKKGNEKILEGHTLLKKVLLFDKKNKLKSLFGLIAEIRKNKYDAVVNVHRHFSSGLLTALSGAKEKIGFRKNPLSFLFTKRIAHEWDKHEIQRNQELIADLSDAIAVKPKLYPSAEDWKYITENFAAPFITISPATIWATKALPLERWVALIDSIPSDKKVYLLGSKADTETCNQLKNMCRNYRPEVLTGKLSFLKDAALMANAEMNYVLDSGPLHICSAMNAPVTAVFCSTSPNYGFGPLSDISFIVETKEKLNCRPCGAHGHKKCPEGHFRCAEIAIFSSQ